MQTTSDKVVLFADLLGFASLTEECTLDLNLIKAFDRPFTWTIDMILEAADNHLIRAFTGFHHALKDTLDLAHMRYPLTAITFSDSAFIATTHLFEAASIAIGLVQSLLLQRIPLRVGIAHGSFEAVRFRSDVTADGGDHAAHFLGTGVVRSHVAESCGIKGARILLHPSAASLLSNRDHNPPDKDQIRYVECSEEERNNKAGVQYELDYWRFRLGDQAKAWHALQDMWDGAPQVAIKHYQATAEAINRMRIAQGESPLSRLRRRTLPRKVRKA